MRDDHHYRISSFCSTTTCMGVAVTSDGVELLDLADEAAGRLRVGPEAWCAFVAGVKAGEFDLPASS